MTRAQAEETIALQRAQITRLSRELLTAYAEHGDLRARLKAAYQRSYRQRRRAELWRARALR